MLMGGSKGVGVWEVWKGSGREVVKKDDDDIHVNAAKGKKVADVKTPIK